MQQYLDLLRDVSTNGVDKTDRTGTGTRSVFGRMFRHDLSKGFPLLTTKKLHWKSIVHELLWFISGNTNIKYLNDNGVRIWDAWADKDGNLGPIYGRQWRRWTGRLKQGRITVNATPRGNNCGAYLEVAHVDTIYTEYDQLLAVEHSLRTNPDSRRHIVSAWNVAELSDMALPPCHLLYQFYVADGRLSCLLTQRSADLLLGIPFNIASYALLTHMMAQTTGLTPGELIISFGDLHIYNNHFEQVAEQLTREPYPLPMVKLNPAVTCIDLFKFDDIELIGYNAHPHIKAEVAV